MATASRIVQKTEPPVALELSYGEAVALRSLIYWCVAGAGPVRGALSAVCDALELAGVGELPHLMKGNVTTIADAELPK